MNWSKPFDRGSGTVLRGRGIAIANKAVISPTTSVAIVNVSADGTTTLYCGTVDMGQGSDTAMAQIVGEVLNMPAESIRVVPRDTDVTPYDMGTLGSRSLFHMGHAVKLAAEEARRQDQGDGARSRRTGRQQYPARRAVPEEIRHAGRQYHRHRHLQAGLHAARSGDRLLANVTPFWMCAASGAEVEVDTETGKVRIIRYINVVDCGKPINPKIVETQISGASLMQLGFTHVREDASRRRPGHQRVAGRLQDSRHP